MIETENSLRLQRVFGFLFLTRGNGPFGGVNDPFRVANGPFRAASDPNTSTNDPFGRANVRFHTKVVNSSPLSITQMP